MNDRSNPGSSQSARRRARARADPSARAHGVAHRPGLRLHSRLPPLVTSAWHQHSRRRAAMLAGASDGFARFFRTSSTKKFPSSEEIITIVPALAGRAHPRRPKAPRPSPARNLSRHQRHQGRHRRRHRHDHARGDLRPHPQHSIWYSVNLLGGAGVASWTQSHHRRDAPLSLAALAHRHRHSGATTLLVGLLYGAMLPMLPRHPVLLGGILAPVLWTGILHIVLGIINPYFADHIDWWSFASRRSLFGLVAGYIVTQLGHLERLAQVPLSVRLGVETPGLHSRPRRRPTRKTIMESLSTPHEIVAASPSACRARALPAAATLPGNPPEPEVPRPEAVVSLRRALQPRTAPHATAPMAQNGAGHRSRQSRVPGARRRRHAARRGSPTAMQGHADARPSRSRSGGMLTDAADRMRSSQGMRTPLAQAERLRRRRRLRPTQPRSPAIASQASRSTGRLRRCHGAIAQQPGKTGPSSTALSSRSSTTRPFAPSSSPAAPTSASPTGATTSRATPLTDDEITNVSAWLMAQTPALPGQPYPNQNPASANQPARRPARSQESPERPTMDEKLPPPSPQQQEARSSANANRAARS